MTPAKPSLIVTVTQFVCGLILLTAVALKVFSSVTANAAESLSHFSPQLQLLGLEAEAVVGLWLLSGYALRGAWLAALTLFTTLGVMSGYLAATGQPSCGCFGRIEVNPWVSLALDLACVVALAVARPEGIVDLTRVTRRRLISLAVGAIAVVGLVWMTTTGRLDAGLARLRGESLVLGSVADAGAAPLGEKRTVSVTIENVSRHDVRLIGGTATCPCVATDDLPQTIPAGSRASLHVEIKYTGQPGEFKHMFQWYTDEPAQKVVTGYVTGRVEPPGRSNETPVP